MLYTSSWTIEDNNTCETFINFRRLIRPLRNVVDDAQNTINDSDTIKTIINEVADVIDELPIQIIPSQELENKSQETQQRERITQSQPPNSTSNSNIYLLMFFV